MLDLYDLNGRLVRTATVADSRFTMPVGDLARGVYLLRTTAADGTANTTKLILK